jgi:hypothetical protein
MIVVSTLLFPTTIREFALKLPSRPFQIPLRALAVEIVFHSLHVMVPLPAFSIMLALHPLELKFKVLSL